MIVENDKRRLYVEVEGDPHTQPSVLAIHGGPGWGAILAVEYALARNIEALVLVNPLRVLRVEGQDGEVQGRRIEAVDPSLFTDYVEALQPQIAAAMAGDATKWPQINANPWWARMLETQLAAPPSEDWRRTVGDIAWGIDTYFDFKGAAFSDPTHELNRYDLSERAKDVRSPTLIFASDNDANYVAPARLHANLIAEALPAARIVSFDDCGHFPFAEAPDAFAAAAADFLRTCRSMRTAPDSASG